MHRPWLGRTFGVEMEMNGTNGEMRARISGEMIQRAVNEAVPDEARRNWGSIHYYPSDGGRTWDTKTDSSCGFEVCSPALYMDESGGNAELAGVCGALNALRPKINSHCGLHIHADCSDLNWRQLQRLVRLWTRYEPFFFSLQPKSRRAPINGSWYTPALRASEFGDTSFYGYSTQAACSARTRRGFESAARSLGRSSLNISGWWRHGRVEFRLGAGTTNYEKITRWAQLLLSVVARAKASKGFLGNHPFKLTELPGADLTTKHMFKVLGLAPSPSLSYDETPLASATLLEWATTRRGRFALGNAREEV